MKWLYRALYITVGTMLFLEILNRAWYNAFLCLLTLALFTIPRFLEQRIKINVPDVLEVVVLLFIFAAEILGELRDYYYAFPYWDVILHTMNGFLCAAIGLSLINILNNSPAFAVKLSPIFVVLFAFCFSMTVGVMWEFFEYAMDTYFGANMQKDTVFANGYVDIGLIDTMEDLFVNFVGAVVSSVLGYFYVKHNGRAKILSHFMLSRIERGTRTRTESGDVHSVEGLKSGERIERTDDIDSAEIESEVVGVPDAVGAAGVESAADGSGFAKRAVSVALVDTPGGTAD
jgi:hypothetical protein